MTTSRELFCGSPALDAVQQWLERAVIGLNLCPFARAVHVKGQIRWVDLTGVTDAEDARPRIESEMEHLAGTGAAQTDTTLVVMPDTMPDFHEFSRFADSLNASLKRLKLRGVLQVASFHPRFEFAGEPPGSRSHFTNRAPHPVIHLLREASIDRAVERFPDTDSIWQTNIERLGTLSDTDFEHVFPQGN